MSFQCIRQSIENVFSYFKSYLKETRSADKLATTILMDGLRFQATRPSGAELISDMPQVLGSGGTAPSPGWLMLAELANCGATLITIRAAQLGVQLTVLEVTAESISDDRGMLGMDKE